MITADLTGRAPLVSGGASGIGLATVTRLAELGAQVALNHLPGDPAGPPAVARLSGRGLAGADRRREAAERALLKRNCQPEDVADAIVFLRAPA